MKKIPVLVLSCAVIFSMAGNICAAQEEIVISCSGDNQELIRVLAVEFEKANPGTKVDVPESIGSSGGIKALTRGTCDLARIARPLKDKEKADGLDYKIFAYSPVVFAVNPGVKGIDSMTFEQLLGVFSGRIASWSELGGKKQKIYTAQRESGDSCLTVLEKNIPGWDSIEKSSNQIIYSTPEMIRTIAKYDNTIGYAPLSMVKNSGLKVIKIAGVYPSVENIKDGSYRLAVPFGIAWKGELQGAVRAFVDFILSPEGQSIIADNGAVPLI